MGFLDNSSITVDAVLTKKGREILSRGGNLDIGSFTLSDTGVDYTLWNTDHPSGSANYGEAIELGSVDGATYYNRGFAHGELGEYEKAIEDLDLNKSGQHGGEIRCYTLAICYEELGEHEKAMDFINKTLTSTSTLNMFDSFKKRFSK